jgi:DNA-3-methyladenine glycosylase II
MFKKEKRYLVGRDPKLKAVLDREFKLTLQSDHFRSLCQSIVGQQLAGKAAKKIWERLLENADMSPGGAIAAGYDTLRKVGLSGKKSEYILGIAQAFSDGTLDHDFSQMGDEEIIQELVKLRGIGRWTAEMFLIFSLGRMDIFANDDYGLRKAVQKLYKLDELPKKAELEEITFKWKPYRTVASLALWKWID